MHTEQLAEVTVTLIKAFASGEEAVVVAENEMHTPLLLSFR
jgi:hypothetical protein